MPMPRTPTKLHRDDLLAATLSWTLGECFSWNQQMKQFNSSDVEFMDFVHRTHRVIWRYIHHQLTLDGSCSDLECALGNKALYIFGFHTFPVSQEG